MCVGADSIDDLDMLRVGGMPILFDGVYAPSTFGTLLREFSFGHARQLESVLREHLGALAERTKMLVGIDEQAFIDIDSLLRPVYGHAKQGASYACVPRNSGGLEAMILGLTCGNASRHASEACL